MSSVRPVGRQSDKTPEELVNDGDAECSLGFADEAG
jgi:hypothetical protein